MLQVIRGYLTGIKNGGRRRRGIRVLTYHGVVNETRSNRLERNLCKARDFQRHIQFLHRVCVIDIRDMTVATARHKYGQRDAALVTFDDGYANNLLAAEMLARYHMPWALFVSTATIGGDKAIWTVELSLLILHGEGSRIDLLDRIWPLGNQTEREFAFHAIRTQLKTLPAANRREQCDLLRAQFPPEETARLLEEFPSMRMMTWQEIQQLVSEGVVIGSHGVMHENHHSGQPPEICLKEMVESKREIEVMTVSECLFFSFPNGDTNERSESDLTTSGYRYGFTTQPGTISGEVSSLLLPRISAPSSLSRFVENYYWQRE